MGRRRGAYRAYRHYDDEGFDERGVTERGNVADRHERQDATGLYSRSDVAAAFGRVAAQDAVQLEVRTEPTAACGETGCQVLDSEPMLPGDKGWDY